MTHAPNAAEGWLAMGRIHQMRGRHGAAAEAYLISSNAAPTWATPRQYRIEALFDLGRIAEAADDCRALIPLAPREQAHRLNLARALSRLGRGDEALAVLREAVKDGHDTAEVAMQMGHVQAAAGRSGAALIAFRRAASLDPHAPDPPFLIAQMLTRQNDHRRAAEALQAAYCRSPRSAPVLHALAESFTRAGDRSRALGCFRAAVEANPSHAQACEGLVTGLRERGELKAAIRVAREGLRLSPNDFGLLRCLAVTQMHDRDGPGAVASARACVAAHPDDSRAHGVLLQAFEFNGQLVEAGIAARQAAEANARHQAMIPAVLAQWAANARDLARVEARLPEILRGVAKPGGADETLSFGMVCARKGLNRAALHFFRGLRLGAGGADLAARAAARLARGEENDRPPDAAERAQAARTALASLSSALPQVRRGISAGPAAARQQAAAQARRWLEADDFAPWRDGDGPTRLDPVARSQWQCLWAELRAVVALAETQGL